MTLCDVRGVHPAEALQTKTKLRRVVAFVVGRSAQGGVVASVAQSPVIGGSVRRVVLVRRRRKGLPKAGEAVRLDFLVRRRRNVCPTNRALGRIPPRGQIFIDASRVKGVPAAKKPDRLAVRANCARQRASKNK